MKQTMASLFQKYARNECAGHIFLEKAPGMDVAGFLARTWHDPDKGVEGTDMVQCSLVSDERVVAPDCLYVVKNVLA